VRGEEAAMRTASKKRNLGELGKLTGEKVSN